MSNSALFEYDTNLTAISWYGGFVILMSRQMVVYKDEDWREMIF